MSGAITRLRPDFVGRMEAFDADWQRMTEYCGADFVNFDKTKGQYVSFLYVFVPTPTNGGTDTECVRTTRLLRCSATVRRAVHAPTPTSDIHFDTDAPTTATIFF